MGIKSFKSVSLSSESHNVVTLQHCVCNMWHIPGTMRNQVAVRQAARSFTMCLWGNYLHKMAHFLEAQVVDDVHADCQDVATLATVRRSKVGAPKIVSKSVVWEQRAETIAIKYVCNIVKTNFKNNYQKIYPFLIYHISYIKYIYNILYIYHIIYHISKLQLWLWLSLMTYESWLMTLLLITSNANAQYTVNFNHR